MTSPAVTTIPCLRCKAPFERKTRGQPMKYCPPCRGVRKNEADRDRRLIAKNDRDLLHSVAENLREYVTPDMWQTVQEYIANTGGKRAVEPPLVDDRMPVGTMTHAGPDEGISTTLPDLAQELDSKRMEVIMHDWFIANPHWLEGVND